MSLNKILIVHNYYQQSGGEDQVFMAESSLIGEHKCQVFRFTVHNDRIKRMNSLTLARTTLWNKSIARELQKIIRRVRPDIIHFHNTFSLISPAAYYAARAERIPVVQTLHNYRLLCPNALFFRNGHVCEDCMGKFVPWPGVLYACYRNSRTATSVTAAMLSVHRVLRTYSRMVDMYIALTDFARQKFIQGGLPAEKIEVKPNFFYQDPGERNGVGNYALYVGRLSVEKGILALLKTFNKIGKIPLKIIGDGPLMDEISKIKIGENLSDVDLLLAYERKDVLKFMKGASFLIFPSECYEGFPVTIAEAFACGLPVLSSRLGGMAEIVEDGVSGLLFEPGNSDDLAEKVKWLVEHPDVCRRMGKNARHIFLEKYTAEKNYETLMNIYKKTIHNNKKNQNEKSI